MKPYLKNNRTNQVDKAVLRRLSEGDLGALMRAQEAAIKNLETGIYVRQNREEFAAILMRGLLLGVFTDAGLCGAVAIAPPLDSEENPGVLIGLSASENARSALIYSLFVVEEYRGNGVARELILAAIRQAVEQLGAQYVLAAVSPKSIGCILSLMSVNGVRLRALRQMHGCRLRYIFCYNHEDKRLFTAYERYALSDTYSVSKGLANQHEGIATFRSADGIFIWLAK